MSRITKGKLEKTKMKVVFRLQFHVTHIPHAGWDKLFITCMPANSGKATAKTSKANVRNGTCKWADPIYETTRLLQDTKTKEYEEKLYKLVVATVSSRSSVLGEVTINLAHYADALKPSAVALPIQGCDSGSILHITVQLLTAKTGFREFEQQRELRERGLQATSDASVAQDTINDQLDKDARVCRNVNQSSSPEDILHNDTKSLALVVENFKAQSLKSSIDHLLNELEKMKKDNLLIPREHHYYDPIFHGLQREVVQLHKVNEELGNIFPIFNEFSSGGNALERILALEVELAETLKAKKKSSFHFQSSFLEQHNDEAAVFQSFRDINEIIKDMLEFKGKYATVDAELKEMHDRYSQLSLQFAEVEGERQKLVMTFKNVRGSRKYCP